MYFINLFFMNFFYTMIDSVPCTIPFISVTYSLRNWRPVSPAPLPRLCPAAPPPSLSHQCVLLIGLMQLSVCLFIFKVLL